MFTWRAELTDDWEETGNHVFFHKMIIYNHLTPLEPTTGTTITISADSTYSDGTNNNQSFNNVIGGKTDTQTSFLKLEVNGDADLTLDYVAIGSVVVNADKEATLLLAGENNLGDVINNGTLILNQTKGAKFKYNIITNNGTFIDSTGTVTNVAGNAAIEIIAKTTEDQTVEHGNSALLKADIKVEDKSNVSFEWQKLDSDNEWKKYPTTKTKAVSNSGSLTVSESGTYRCLVTCTNGNASTTLLIPPVTVTVKSAENPPYNPSVPTYYTVTLPDIDGATFTPKPGNHTVEEDHNFSFSILLDADYDLSIPVVKANGVTIEPRTSDGKYVINNIEEDITITISGIQKNSATSNAVVSSGISRIYALKGIVHIDTATAADAWVITLGGQILRQLHLAPGSNQIQGLDQGLYIIRLSDGTNEKVRVR